MAEDCWLQARLYLGLEHSPEQQDSDSLCFSILVGHGQSHSFRVELAADLAVWEKSFQRAVFLEVQRVRVSIPMDDCACFILPGWLAVGFIMSARAREPNVENLKHSAASFLPG